MYSWGVAIELILEPTTKLGFIIVKLEIIVCQGEQTINRLEKDKNETVIVMNDKYLHGLQITSDR